MFSVEKEVLLDVSLTSFEGGEGETSMASETAEVGNLQSDTGEEVVVYGKAEDEPEVTEENESETDGDTGQDDEQQEQPEEGSEQEEVVDREKQFEELIKGDFKDIFGKRVQSIIDQRFKQAKTVESELERISPIVELLMDKYGVKNPEDLLKTVEEETIEELAYKEGMDVDTYRRIRAIEQENRNFKMQQENEIAKIQQQEKVNRWFSEAEELKSVYPDFDLREQAQNDKFLELLNSNVSVKTAYEVLNIDKIKEKAIKATKEAVVDNIKSRSKRPKEAGTQKKNGVVYKSSVKDLTKEDRAEIARRVAMGETIRF